MLFIIYNINMWKVIITLLVGGALAIFAGVYQHKKNTEMCEPYVELAINEVPAKCFSYFERL